MTRRILYFLVLATLLSQMTVSTAAAKMNPELDGSAAVERIDQFNLQKQRVPMISDELTPEQARENALRLPLGVTAANAGIGIGEIIDNTYDDFQATMKVGKYVGTTYDNFSDPSVGVEVHFNYEELSSIDTATTNYYKSGYNFYNASNASGTNWPEGQESGCQLDGLHQYGGSYGANLALLPDGRLVFGAGSDMRSEHTGENDSTTNLDNLMFFQQDKTAFNRCYWDSTANVSHIPPAQYQVGWVSEGTESVGQARDPVVAVHIVGSDTVTHCLMSETQWTWIDGWPQDADYPGWHTYSYFRKVGTATPGSWTGPTVIDTNFWVGMGLAASPVSSKVAIAGPKVSPLGRLNSNFHDRDVYYIESTDGGLTWPTPMTNITSYPRNAPSWSAKTEIELMYDHNDNLHILWTAQPTPDNPYRGGYHWPDFGADLFHWSDAIAGSHAGGTISLVQYGSYDVNPIACSYGGYNAGYIGWFNMTECDGNLYVIYDIWHSRVLELGIVPEAYDDCGAVIESDGTHSSNAEIFLNVSSTLDGLLWDAPRNLTNTYTPDCDSVGGEGGPCGNEYKPYAEMYALDPTGLGTLTWPAAALVDPGVLVGLSAYTGDFYFNAQYHDDQYPGTYDRDISEFATFNSQKWLRIACVDPIEAPQIDASPTEIAWPQYMRYNEDSSYTVTVTNNGNVELQVTSIATSGEGWLSTSVPSLNVSAGASPDNQGTFDINVSTAGFTTPQFLDGEVYLISNVEPDPPNSVDTLFIDIHLLVADTVEPAVFDTVATSTAWDAKSATGSGDNTALAVSNFGEMGQNGQLGVNLDFGVDGSDPGNRSRDSMYVYTGGLFLLQNDGGDVSISTSLQQVDQATSANGYTTAYSFDPVPGNGSMTGGVHVDGGEVYDSVYTGRMASRDTAVYVERTFYAPRNMSSTYPNFVVVKSKIFTGTKGAQSNLTFGDVMDWDVPSDAPPINNSATSIAADVTYMRGTVDPDSSFAWDNSQRFAAEAMMGWYWESDHQTYSDSCVNNTDYHGSFGTYQPMMDDSLYAPGVYQPDAQMWWDSIANYDYNSGNSTDTDQTIWMTYLHDFSLPDTDTLVAWTAFATIKQGSVSDLEATVAAARQWYMDYLRTPVDPVCSPGCCLPPTVGDVDQSGAVDITDISVLIDNQFLTLTPLVCEDEGDVDYSGVVDITDLSVLIDNQFLTLTPLGPCP